MDTKNKTILVILCAIALGWFFRYDVHVVSPGGQGTNGVGYMVNRWTGTVFVMYGTGIRELKEPPVELK